MEAEENRYRRTPWTWGGRIGCAVWPVAAFLFLDPMAELTLAPCFFEEGCGWFDGVGLWLVLIASMLAALAFSVIVRMAINLVFGATTR
jgi:hypothetical protein